MMITNTLAGRTLLLILPYSDEICKQTIAMCSKKGKIMRYKMYIQVVSQLPQKAKINTFGNLLYTLHRPSSEMLHLNFFLQKTLILACEENSATSTKCTFLDIREHCVFLYQYDQ